MSVKLSRIACQQCGANLEIAADVRFVTCRYCSSNLEVVHETSVSFTKQLDELSKRTAGVEHEVRILRLGREIDQLDEQWEAFRQAVSMKTKDGSLVEPDSPGAKVVPFLIMVVAAVFLGSIGVSNEAPAMFLVVLAVILMGGVFVRSAFRKAEIFRTTRSRYVQRRTLLLGELRGLERESRLPPMKRSGRAG